MKLFSKLLFLISIFSQLNYGLSIVFIHIGTNLPNYCVDSIQQALLFNQKISIYLIANNSALENANPKLLKFKNLKIIKAEKLIQSNEHKKFLHNSKLIKNNSGNFWIYTSERFFYLDEFISQFDKKDVVHLENDVMLYTDLNKILPTFKNYYPGLAAVFDNEIRCIPSFVYISDKYYSNKLAKFFADNATLGLNDMQMIAKFKNTQSSKVINNLPTIMNDYIKKHGLKSQNNHKTNHPDYYSSNIESFNSIFDAAAIGQYLGGIDPIHGKNNPGFINESCLFNASFLKYSWQKDLLGRYIPYAIFNNKKYKINNLHIHSKNLKRFSSLNEKMP